MILGIQRRQFVHSHPLLIGCVMLLMLSCAPDAPASLPENPENADNSVVSDAIPPAPTTTAETAVVAAESAESTLSPLREAVKKNPQSVDDRRRLARALHDLNFKEASVEQFEALLEIDPSARTLLEMGIAYTAAARFDDAIKTYDRLLEIKPEDPITLHNLGSIAHRRDDYETAIQFFQRAIAAQPDYLRAHRRLGDALKAAERYRDAYRAYEGVLQLEPRNPAEAEQFVDSMYELASLDLMMGAYQRAGQFLTEVLRVSPEHPNAYYAYGQVLLQLNQPELAQQALDRHAQLLQKRQTDASASGAN